MKRSFYILIPVAFLLLFVSACKKGSLMTYDASDNIYFNYVASLDPVTYSDTVNLTFAFSANTVQDTLLKIPVAVTGTAKKTDRNFSVTVDPNSTAAASTDYVLPSSFLVHAGKIEDTISILFKRTAAIKVAPVFLTLRLRENDQFKTQLIYRSRRQNQTNNIEPGDSSRMQTFKVNLSDMLQEGPYWDNYHYYFGDFSEKKVRLINQLTGMPLDFWSTDLYSSNEQLVNAIYYGGFTFRYLSDQAYNGNIILEADGITPMTMGANFQ